MMITPSANDTERDRVRNGRSRDWVSSVLIANTGYDDGSGKEIE